MNNKLYWTEIQSGLSRTGLKASVVLGNGIWGGHIDEKPFAMTISPKNESYGLRDYMIISLYGQDIEIVIPLLAQFMEYEPFCKYLSKTNTMSSITYEWDNQDPQSRLKELQEDNDIYSLQLLEKDFQVHHVKSVEKFFQQFTPELVAQWTACVQENPSFNINGSLVSDLLPFMAKTLPRFALNQSLFGFSIISLDSKLANEKNIIHYGLDPLLKAAILTSKDIMQITKWYSQTKPSWHVGEDLIPLKKDST